MINKYFCKCGTEINYKTALYGSGLCKYCGHAVHGNYSKRTKHYCLDCKKEISDKINAKRCSSCAKKGELHPSYKDGQTLIQHYCKDCGQPITCKAKRCPSCATKIQLKNPINHPNWQGGKSFESYPLGWNKTFKEQIRYRDEYKCQLCDCHEVECNRKLHVHHIDYDKKNLNINNLIALCQSCHMKTNFNREYWRAYFISIMEKIIHV